MKKNVNAVIFSSPDPENIKWSPVMPDDVPDVIKDPDVMGNLMNGEICKPLTSELWYMAQKHDA